MAHIKHVPEMTTYQVLRAIAERRGEVGEIVLQRWSKDSIASLAALGLGPIPYYGPGIPDYRKWEWAGVLLEELARRGDCRVDLVAEWIDQVWAEIGHDKPLCEAIMRVWLVLT